MVPTPCRRSGGLVLSGGSSDGMLSSTDRVRAVGRTDGGGMVLYSCGISADCGVLRVFPKPFQERIRQADGKQRSFRTNGGQPSMRRRKPERPRLWWGTVPITLICILLLGAAISPVVWLPDVFGGRSILVSRVEVSGKGEVELMQSWGLDGYMTFVRHEIWSGTWISAMGDPDRGKIWRSESFWDETNACAVFRFGSEEWRYYPNSQSLSTGRGDWMAAQ